MNNVVENLREFNRLVPVLAAWGLAVAHCSCSLEDTRDLCCDSGNAMRYSYRPYGAEAFDDYIGTLRHLLFDAGGDFLGELPPGENLKYQPLALGQGEYTMVTVANASDITILNHTDISHIGELTLSAGASHDPEGVYRANTDELYWGVKRFSVSAMGLAMDVSRLSRAIPVTYMNNIHCHLKIKVEWSNMPEHIGEYEMELDGVPDRYSLHPERSGEAGGFTVPPGIRTGTHRIRVPLRSRELDGEFVTLRYSNDCIPVFRLFFDSEKVSPDIDLARAFDTWGWRPSDTHVQNYEILIQMNSDGSADIFPNIEASVADWVNGGSFN